MATHIPPTATDNPTSPQAPPQAETQETQDLPSAPSPPSPSHQITHSTTPTPPSSFHAIQALLAPFNTLFNTLVSSLRHPLITHIDLTLPVHDSPLPYPIYTFHAAPLAFARGAAAFPAATPAALQRALQKLDLCDVSVHMMRGHAQRVLDGVGARVSWVVVCGVPRFLVRYGFEEAGLSFHSVCLVSTAGGEEFVADFTLEQFGYPQDRWFMRWDEYRDGMCEDEGKVADQEWVDFTEKLSQGENLYVLRQALNEACKCVGDEVFRGLEEGEREGYVKKCALKAVEVWDVDE
ncbi:hypothetical protein BDU57DRAFT_279491 [Ampelomyces quisqualis]|uniref:Uncharacterized protein n=1 Tax=Ampelomyces quisqualis TaxID=50730 RepID=A0A6A5QNP4_AMPQU|nr:hypothetical protein BDU57DRAFT_279491 [Ampelomyces quisqualis]